MVMQEAGFVLAGVQVVSRDDGVDPGNAKASQHEGEGISICYESNHHIRQSSLIYFSPC